MKTFKQYFLTEGTQKGFAYEINAANALKPFGIVPDDFTPAGSGSSIPDLMIQKNGKKVGCELKITPTTAGSLVIHRKDGIWKLGKTFKIIDGNEVPKEEKVLISDLANKYGVIDRLNKEWKADSYKFDIEDDKLSKEKKYQKDKATFQDIKGEIDATSITNYYGLKSTPYFNIGTHGFYIGSSNPLGIKGVPNFADASKCIYRARVQPKGRRNYQFTLAMRFSIPSAKSKYNIAPCKKNNVKIDMKNLNLDWFLK